MNVETLEIYNPAASRSANKNLFTAALLFSRGLLSEISRGGNYNRLVQDGLKTELVKRGINISSPDLESGWDYFDKKLIRPRPRLLGAVAAYAMVSGATYEQITAQNGMVPFRMLWALGAIQDDLIDDLNKAEVAKLESVSKRRELLTSTIFGKERIFYQAAYTVIINHLRSSPDYTSDQYKYMATVMAGWFKFLVEQEAEVFSTPQDRYDFRFCVNYRERQDFEIGRALVTCLNGTKCLEDKFRRLENIIPLLSFRSQIIDDIGDTGEDIELGRPSYVFGALMEHPEELERVKSFLTANKVRKFSPGLLQRLAPLSYELVAKKFSDYGEVLKRDFGVDSKILNLAGWASFYGFPVLRDTIYRISPRYANF